MKSYIKKYILLFGILLITIFLIFYFVGDHYIKIVNENINISVIFCNLSNCKSSFIELLNKSSRVRCAFFSATDSDFIKIINNKNSLILLDKKNLYRLIKNIKIKKDNLKIIALSKRKGIFHEKFCILDNISIITSLNPTKQGFNDINDILIIKSNSILNILSKEINETLKQKSSRKRLKIVSKKLNISIFFCPEDKCKEWIIRYLINSKNNITFMHYIFTDKDLASLLKKLKSKGIKIRGIIDKKNLDKSIIDDIFKNIIIYNSKNYLHTKIWIIDDKIVITGSYNPTYYASRYNDEILLIIESKEVAEKYKKAFQKLQT